MKTKQTKIFTKELLKGKILTVIGIMSPENMGITLPHEHLATRHQGPDVDIVDLDLVIGDIKKYIAAGGQTLVEMSNERIGRDPAALKRVSEETGLNVIMGCGYYKDAWIPFESIKKTADFIAQEIITDIFAGIEVDGECVHAGHIGEIGISRTMTKFEENSLRGAVRAQKATGAALSIHFDLDAEESEHEYVVKILEEELVDTRRVVINHIISKLDNIDRIINLAKQGFNITLDHFGLDIDTRMEKLVDTPFEEQVITIKELLRLGLIDHLMLSQDTCFKTCLSANGGHGYTRILKEIVPFLHRLHVNEYDIERLIMHNARKVFTFGGRFPSY